MKAVNFFCPPCLLNLYSVGHFPRATAILPGIRMKKSFRIVESIISTVAPTYSVRIRSLTASVILLCLTTAMALDTTETVQPMIMETIGSEYLNFIRLDHSNAFNPEYKDFTWDSWKLAIAFVNPSLTKDSLNYNSRIFRDLYPKKSYWTFLTEEIATVWWKNTGFQKVEWRTIPIKNTPDTIEYKTDSYEITFPDSAEVTFHTTGCRFVLLLQRFSPKMRVSGSKGLTLMYQNVAPEASRMENYAHSRIFYSYSFTYVLYDLMEGHVVQFGKAFDDNKDVNTNADDIKKCLDDALMDVIEVSRFYRRQ